MPQLRVRLAEDEHVLVPAEVFEVFVDFHHLNRSYCVSILYEVVDASNRALHDLLKARILLGVENGVEVLVEHHPHVRVLFQTNLELHLVSNLLEVAIYVLRLSKAQ